MTIYVPAHFATDDADALARLMRDHPFATVITPAGGELHVSHLPLLHVPEGGPHGTLVGHFARANPHWQHAGDAESLVVFQGPHAYVSPSWYAAPGRMVPTWNYAAVHAHGTLVPVAGDAEARAVLAALVERFEGARAAPWRLPTPSPQHDAMVGAIVSNEDDGQQAQMPITMTFMVSMVVSSLVIENPTGTLATVLSLVPFFGPSLMFLRITMEAAPAWQIALSITLMIGTIIGAVWLASKIYRVGVLMYGKRPTIPELIKWLRYS